jgi:hypothetical protein
MNIRAHALDASHPIVSRDGFVVIAMVWLDGIPAGNHQQILGIYGSSQKLQQNRVRGNRSVAYSVVTVNADDTGGFCRLALERDRLGGHDIRARLRQEFSRRN